MSARSAKYAVAMASGESGSRIISLLMPRRGEGGPGMSDADRRLIDRIHELAEDRNRWRMRAQDAEQERDQLAASLRRLDAEPKKSFSERHPRLTIAGWIVWTPIALALYGSMFYIVIHLIVTGDAPSF